MIFRGLQTPLSLLPHLPPNFVEKKSSNTIFPNKLFHFSYEILNAPSEKITFLWNFCHLLSFFPVLFYEWNKSINGSFTFFLFLLGIITWKGTLFFNGGLFFSWGCFTWCPALGATLNDKAEGILVVSDSLSQLCYTQYNKMIIK